jgi:LytTr DNA-binding domain
MAASPIMSFARPASFRPSAPSPGKPRFAKRAFGFANRAPGFPMLWIGSAAAAGLMIVTGGFGTVLLPLGQRALFWLVLMGWTAIKWQLWFAATVRNPGDWTRAALIGALLLSLPLPIEIALAARITGIGVVTPDWLGTWARALAIGAVIFVTGLLAARALGYRPRRAAPAIAVTDTLLDRAGVTRATLAAIEAEDHYCRVRRAGGSDALIHYRFGDALNEVGGLDGAQVHRGAWVAASAVTGAVREGRRWRLILADGTRISVSATYLPKIRALGWLKGINRGSAGA